MKPRLRTEKENASLSQQLHSRLPPRILAAFDNISHKSQNPIAFRSYHKASPITEHYSALFAAVRPVKPGPPIRMIKTSTTRVPYKSVRSEVEAHPLEHSLSLPSTLLRTVDMRKPPRTDRQTDRQTDQPSEPSA